MKEQRDDKRPYERPSMTVMKINRFFFGSCQHVWPNCYSFYLFLRGAASCR